MKLIYSELKKFLPTLDVQPQKLRDDLTMIGHFTNFYEEIDNEIIFDLDIKVNRGDCLGYYGLAKDLSIFYNLPLSSLSAFGGFPVSNYSLPIKINSADVYRIQAIKLTGLKNTPSPDWLTKILNLHQINSINTLVDLTNYVAIVYGIPCHAFDTAKTTDNLVWENNSAYQEFVSLDGTKMKLQPQNLIVSDSTKVVSLSFIGSQNSGVSLETTDTIIEMAVYNPTRVRLDSRQQKTITDASIRLEKQLDTETIPFAFSYLITLVQNLTHAQISSQLFEYYPQRPVRQPIEFIPELPSIISGINIPQSFALDIVSKVGHRPDIVAEEDLVEEVVRFWGYQKIPSTQPLPYKQLPDITPKILYLIDQFKDELVAQGFDEVLTWPLVKEAQSANSIKTQNSINNEYIYLRQSLIPSLKLQLDQYHRYKLPDTKFFEIGKVYYQENGQFIEKYALGKYDGQNFSETILDELDKPDSYTPQNISHQAYELTGQIISLDANVPINSTDKPIDLVSKYINLIDPKILWSIQIIDVFSSRITLRVYYYNCDDKTAKKIHLAVFNLNC